MKVNHPNSLENQSLIRLSQGQLNLLEICPPQFQRLYVEQLGSPMSPDVQENLAWGSHFHQLMQQRELGLPLNTILGKDRELQEIIEALVEAVTQYHKLTQQSWKEAEHSRTLEMQGYLLTAIYDLLILDDKRGQILDWKTYLQPQNEQKLRNNWQTRLYLYLLAETSDYLPEQLSLTYWFVKIPHNPQCLTIQYSQKLHQKNQEDLEHLLAQLDSYLNKYYKNNIDFPHWNHCQDNCPYADLFPETIQPEQDEDLLSMIDEIDEVSFKEKIL